MLWASEAAEANRWDLLSPPDSLQYVYALTGFFK